MSLVVFSIKAANLPEGFVEVLIAENLDPTVITESPDGRVFIAEKNGTIRLVENDSILRDPFLQLDVDFLNERGLSGLVFHPDFETNHFFYVYYSVPRESVNRVSRFVANGNYALPSSEKILLETDEIGYIHNAGSLLFGLDGKLYVSVGDLNKPERAQRLNGFNGKFLRLNDDGTVPVDNPFLEQTSGQYGTIWAMGLRNSFCATLDRKTGKIYAGDVGLDAWEEINEIHRAGNYGWDIGEGPIPSASQPPSYADPIHFYENKWLKGCSITGISSYTPALESFPEEYHGDLFFSDYCTGQIRRFDPEKNQYKGVFADGIVSPLALYTSTSGDLYYAARNADGTGSLSDNTSSDRGKVYKISYRGSALPFVSQDPKDLYLIPGDKSFLEVKAFGRDLQYMWYKDSELLRITTHDTLNIGPVNLEDNGSIYYCLVKNELGEVQTEEATVFVTNNTRPQFTILKPSDSYEYRAGDTFTFMGKGEDSEDGKLPDSSLSWNIEFHHDDHSHPFIEMKGVREGEITIPNVGETSSNVWYRITLYGKDREGFSTSTFKDVFPELTDVLLETEPPGLSLNLDGGLHKTPYETKSVWGIKHTASVPLFQFSDDSVYIFDQWASGSTENSIDFEAKDDPELIKAHFIGTDKSKGEGLLGQYFVDSKGDFRGELVNTKVDSIISFRWLSTAPDSLPKDGFSIRWSGFIEAPVSDNYTFHVIFDDGARLWIDQEKIIDDWEKGGERTRKGSKELEAGKKYPIVLEYFERDWNASCELTWSSSFMDRQLILPEFLYPALLEPGNVSQGFEIYPNPARNELNLKFISTEVPTNVEIYDLAGKKVMEMDLEIDFAGEEISLPVNQLSPGCYFVSVIFQGERNFLRFIKM
ncbi:PQQ-dependent sugar dehydrogenase [Membranihabitans maritimus]|uniref:PQQ-dependent sugar dehydrogenase n=1 Tax=Membranihabitans maritimus TaxID=2904244 RepID=UPI001F1818A1|nr:PQQ-dependent sugar dehydrogenase [Membranihabitans maritimus]